MICRYVFLNGKRSKNDAGPDGYCPGHPPKGSGLGAGWVSAIAGSISAAASTINLAWPHIEPIIRTWISNHADFFIRAQSVLQEALRADHIPKSQSSLLSSIEGLRKETEELIAAVYGRPGDDSSKGNDH